MAEVSLEMLQGLMQRMLTEMAGLRASVAGVSSEAAGIQTELAAVRAEMAALRGEQREIRAHLRSLGEDLEAIIRAELAGRLGHFETQIEARLDALEARLPQ